MGQGTERVLVCYTSGTGCTEGVARRIGEVLAREGLVVNVREMGSSPEPDGYAAVVAGSGIRAGNWHPRAKRWLHKNAAALAQAPLAVFSVGIALAHKEPGKREEMLGYTSPMLEKAGLKPVGVGVFAGWYDPARFSALERWVMGIAKAPEGDFRDWDAIESWAADIAARLVEAPATVA